MAYVDNNLMTGENVVYRAKLHAMTLLGPIISIGFGVFIVFSAALLSTPLVSLIPRLQDNGLVSAADLLAFVGNSLTLIGGAWALVAAIRMVQVIIRMSSSEFAVTNKRVIVKAGFLNQSTMELMLSKIESINIQQSMWGRMFNYGNIVLSGTGTTHEPLTKIANPLEFRRQIQGQVSENQNGHQGMMTNMSPGMTSSFQVDQTTQADPTTN